MKTFGLCCLLSISIAHASQPKPVTPDNFPRAESDLYFYRVVENGGFGRFDHTREPAPMDKQTVIRLNRDTLYSAAVFDLDAGPVTVTMPEPGKRFMSLQIINEDHYSQGVYYEPGPVTLTRDGVGTRYVIAAVRTLTDPNDSDDMAKAHALQDSIKVKQAGTGKFEIPNWDEISQNKIRAALLELATTLPDSRGMYGRRGDVDPVRHLIGSALGWGANPPQEALYLNVVPERNDGETVYRLTVGDVPVAGFWSISVYNAEGYFEPNALNAYTVNNITAQRSEDGRITVEFGGCDGSVPNCLPTPENWNYMVRLYRPDPEILGGSWQFLKAEAVQ